MADLEDLLTKTSRTFALSIPLLEQPTRGQVGLAYLLFRIADTFEDAANWPRRRRIEALRTFKQWLGGGQTASQIDDQVERWLEQTPPSDHAGYLELLRATSEVVASYRGLEPAVRSSILRHLSRTIDGMAGFVGRTDAEGKLVLDDLADLRQYCYVVAGIVGELLTNLFVLGAPEAARIESTLAERAATFGEALQLVNILKDSADDAVEGRSYLPAQVDRSEVLQLARRDLAVAGEYVGALQDAGAPRGFVAFTALPVELAWATLECVEHSGPGAKVSREQVMSIVSRLHAALDRGAPAVSAH